MMKRVGVVVVWVLATLGTASLTYAAVSRAGGAVGDNPAVPVAASDIAARVPTTVTTAAVTGTTTTTATTTPDSTTTTTTLGTSPGSTTTQPAGTTTSTTAGLQPTTTQPASRTEWKTVEGVGTVGVSVKGARLELVSATPVAPFHVEAVETEGDSIEVEFKSESSEYRVRAELEGGVVVWDVEGHD